MQVVFSKTKVKITQVSLLGNEVKLLRKIPTIKFHTPGKYFTADNDKHTQTVLISLGIAVPKQERARKKRTKVKLLLEPYPFQHDGIAFIDDCNGRGIIADEMGLGKTIQAIGYAVLRVPKKPILVVCPACVKYNWEEEITKFAGWTDIQVLEGKKPYKINKRICIINYDILHHWKKILHKIDFALVIFDEFHYLRNRSTQRTKAARSFRHVPAIIGLSGTPIEYKVGDLFPFLNMLYPDVFPNWKDFEDNFCVVEFNGFGHKVVGAKNMDLLRARIKDFVIRRRKTEVLKELPPKERITLPVHINMKAYDRALEDFRSRGKEQSDIQQRAALAHIKQAIVAAKFAQMVEWIEDYLGTGAKLVVFGVHTDCLKLLHKRFKSSVLVTGSTPAKKRQVYKNKFQEDSSCNLFLGQLQAAGVGITLTSAYTTLIYEIDWFPGRHYQAEARVHRIGQTHRVGIYYMIAKGTIEEKLMELLNECAEQASQILEGKNLERIDMFGELKRYLF